MLDSVFREYDIRGKVNTELILEEVYTLGCAIAYYFLYQNSSVKTIAICIDGRVHSEFIKNELSRAFQGSGINVLFIGLGPTPALYFSLHTLPVDAGLMITASHNGKEYNGIKMCLGKDCLWGSQIMTIKDLYNQKKAHHALKKGWYKEYDIIEKYTHWLAKQFKHLKDISLPLAIDLGSGATCAVVPELARLLGWKNVTFLFDKIDPDFKGHQPDPTQEKNMHALKKELSKNSYEFGIGFDGDGDRMAPMSNNGSIIPGDVLIGFFSRSILKNNPQRSVVYDIKCCTLLKDFLNEHQGVSIVSPSGHSLIKYRMKLYDSIFGGELSCHFFFNDRYFGYDDGIYAALRFIELNVQGETIDQCEQLFPKIYTTKELRIECARVDKPLIIQAAHSFFTKLDGAKISTIDGVHVTTSYGSGLIRSSNTQEAVTMRFESLTQEGLEKIKRDFHTALKGHIDTMLIEGN